LIKCANGHQLELRQKEQSIEGWCFLHLEKK
jgi:hypothetical protein